MIAWLRVWIMLSALLIGAGWILSAAHQLNGPGYAVAFIVALAARWLLRRQSGPASAARKEAPLWHKLRIRFRRTAPRLYLGLLCLAGLGGFCYLPSAGDAAMYRTPRVLHWLAAGQWHWIHTFDIRMNIAGCGIEWLTAPWLLVTGSDHLIFLINLISSAFLPGLIFSVFRQLGVTGRAAWWWMWILAAGFCYVFQAGSQANDGYAAVYALAAVNFALRAVHTGKPGDLWVSMLAAAITTAIKPSNIPLALLWVIAALPAIRVLRRRPCTAVVAILTGLLVSAVPMMILNLLHDGNWMGVPKHPGADWVEWQSVSNQSPFWGVIGNAFCLTLQQMAPPFFPGYESWNDRMLRFVQTPWGRHFSSFEFFGRLTAFPTEQTAGLGFMVFLLLAASAFWTWRWKRKNSDRPPPRNLGWQVYWLRFAPWGLLLLFMAKVSSMESARLLSPYYPFLLPAALGQAGAAFLVRKRWWQRLGLLSMAVTGLLLVLSPIRPLFPVETLTGALLRQFNHSRILARAQSYYQAPEINGVMRRFFQRVLPPEEPVIGYATTVMGLEPALWQPNHQRVERVRPDDSAEYLKQKAVRYVVVDSAFLTAANTSIEELMRRFDARPVDQLELSQGWNKPPTPVYLIRVSVHSEASPTPNPL
jgi:hypothetical protein